MADPAVRRQMVEAARVMDQPVRAAQAVRREREHITAQKTDIQARRPGPLLGQGERGGGQIDGVHLEAALGEQQRVAAEPAAEVQRPPSRDEPPVQIGHEVLVRLRREERHGSVPVRIEIVPPSGRPTGPTVTPRREQPVQESQYVLHRADAPVHPALPPMRRT